MYALWNNFKTTLLMSALMGLALGIGYLIGGPHALVPALVIGGLMNFIAFFFSDKIALATMRARPVSREQDPALWDMVHILSERAGLPMPGVYMSPQAAPNAFATGRGPRHSAVCVTAGLRQMLSDHELAGVIAHELSHVKHRDVLISTVAAVIAGAISMVAYMAMWFGGRDNDRNPLVALLLWLFAPLAAMVIQAGVSRSREYEADRLGAELAGSPRGLADALHKLELANRRMPMPVLDAQRSMMIVEPFAGADVARLFATHPPMQKRIERLMAMER